MENRAFTELLQESRKIKNTSSKNISTKQKTNKNPVIKNPEDRGWSDYP